MKNFKAFLKSSVFNLSTPSGAEVFWTDGIPPLVIKTNKVKRKIKVSMLTIEDADKNLLKHYEKTLVKT